MVSFSKFSASFQKKQNNRAYLIACAKRLELLVKLAFTFLVGGSLSVLFQFNGQSSWEICLSMRVIRLHGRVEIACLCGRFKNRNKRRLLRCINFCYRGSSNDICLKYE